MTLESLVHKEVHIRPVESADQLDAVRALFREYGELMALRHGAGFLQPYAQEVAQLPGDYGPPGGRLLLALVGDQAVGCAGLRRLTANASEMKRLYVRPEGRGQGIGRRLTSAIIDDARQLGYARLRLDTLLTMTEALALYRSLDFQAIDAYLPNHPPGALCLERSLA